MTQEQARRLGFTAFTLFLASVVSAQKIRVEFDQGADFSKYKTFSIRGGQLNSQSPALNSELTQEARPPRA